MADVDRDEIEQRHQEVEFQKLKTSIRLQAMKSALAFEQARSQYFASVKARSFMRLRTRQNRRCSTWGRRGHQGLEWHTTESSPFANT